MATANIRAVITAEDRASGVLKGFGTKVESLGDKVSHSLNRARKAFELAAVAATGFAIKSASDLEKTNTSFQILIGNVEQANKLFGEIKEFADKTPFQFPELASATRLLLGYGVSVEKSFDLLKRLGDAAGATGGDINGITLAFSQMIGRGKVTGDNLRQLTENFVNLRPELAKIANVELKDFDSAMMDGVFTSDMLIKALEEATNKGGRFFQGTDKLARTFSGRMSTLKDTIAELGRNLLGVRVDPELGFVVQEGGVFDRLSKAILWLNNNLPRLRDSFARLLSPIRDFIEGGITGLIKAWEFLRPSLVEFWTTIDSQLFPALRRLWKEAIEPLMPVLGTIFVGILFVVTNALSGVIQVVSNLIGWWNLLIEAIKRVVGWFQNIYNKLDEGKGAWGDFKRWADEALGPINEIVGFLIDGIDSLISKIDTAQEKAGGFGKSIKSAVGSGILNALPGGRALKTIKDSIFNRQLGGTVSRGDSYMVGERRPELFVPREAGRIVPQPNMRSGNQTINLNVNVGMYAGTEMEKRKIAESLMRAWQDVQQARGAA